LIIAVVSSAYTYIFHFTFRNSQEGYLEVDGRKTLTIRAPGKLRQLNTDTGLYVGMWIWRSRYIMYT